MPDVRLSEAAGTDLAEFDTYGAERFGDDAADAYQRGIDRVLTRLESFPLSGEERPEFCIIRATLPGTYPNDR